jgi:hypothetical protein
VGKIDLSQRRALLEHTPRRLRVGPYNYQAATIFSINFCIWAYLSFDIWHHIAGRVKIEAALNPQGERGPDLTPSPPSPERSGPTFLQ